jgi:hypothetical protein
MNRKLAERVDAEIDQASHSIFEPDEEAEPPSHSDVLKALGRKGARRGNQADM